MWDGIFLDNHNFKNFGAEHLVAFIGCWVLIGGFLYFGRSRWTKQQGKVFVTLICLLGAFTQIFKVFYRLKIGTFDTTTDLPLHLCNLMTLFVPFMLWFEWRKAWGVVFFWIMAGCAQSIFTPTLTETMPNYEAIRYWLVHASIILGALWGIWVYGYTLHWKDVLNSWICINLLSLVLYPINVTLGSNYMYLNGKPPGPTFYDLLAPWPNYILQLEFVVLLIFSIFYMLFRKSSFQRQLA
ncbi:MAG: TIGR02206 family membrane protein [Saprospiraceae bacterium]